MTEGRKPCGRYHPLPCGLDINCPVPAAYHDTSLTDAEVYELYEESDE